MRVLSSSFTFFLKFIFSGFWIIGFGTGAIIVLSQKWESGLTTFGIWILASSIIFFTIGSSKKVSIDDNYLYVSNFYKTNKISLSSIRKISENRLISPRMIFIHFLEPTHYGKKIHFLAEHKTFLIF